MPVLASYDNDLIPTRDTAIDYALHQFQTAESYWSPIYREAMIDHMYFLGGEYQWDRDVRSRLIAARRPALSFNAIQQYVYGVVNEQKQNPTEAQIEARNGGDQKIAQVLQDMERQIRTSSVGKPLLVAYKDMVVGGIGFAQLCHERVHQRTNKQHVIWKPVEWSAAYLDPAGTFPTYHDAEYAFKFYDLTRETFRRLYPNAVATSAWDPFNAAMSAWICEAHIRVAEHYYTKHRERTLMTMEDGSEKFEDEFEFGDRPLLGPDGKPLDAQKVDFREVWLEVISAAEVLEQSVRWVTDYIPLVPCFGEREVIDGQVHVFGMVRPMRDPQIAANYMRNHLIEAVGAASKAQFAADPAHFEDFEEYYKDANVTNRLVIPMHLINPVTGEQMPPPIPLNQNTPVDEINIAIQAQDLALQQSAGQSASAFGQQSGDESAEAILARQRPGERASYRFTDSYNTTLIWGGTQIIDMIRKVCDLPQILHLEGRDGKPYKAAVFNSEMQPDVMGATLAEGVQGLFDLAIGDYNFAVSTMPAYEVMRDETQKALAAVASSLGQMPDKLAIVLPFWIRSMNFPGHEELADALTPPGMKLQNGDPKAQLQQAQQQMQQMQQMIQDLSAKLQEAAFERKAEQTKLIQVAHIDGMKQQHETQRETARLASAERIKRMDVGARVSETLAKLEHDRAGTILDHEIARINQDKDHSHDVHMALFDAANAMAGKQFDVDNTPEPQTKGNDNG